MELASENAPFRTVVVTNSEGKQQVLHIHQDSDSKMEAMFNPNEMYQTVPYKERNLPKSFFNPPNQSRKIRHSHSKSTGLLDMSMPNHAVLNGPSCELLHKSSVANSNSNNNNATHLMPPSAENHIYPQTSQLKMSSQTNYFDSMIDRKRNQFSRVDRKRSYQSQVAHARSKSFPELLDLKKLADESGNGVAGYEGLSTWQFETEKKRFASENEPVPVKNMKTDFDFGGFQQPYYEEPVYHKRVNSGPCYDQFPHGTEHCHVSHDMTSQNDSYCVNSTSRWTNPQVQENQFGNNFESHQPSFVQQNNSPIESSAGSSLMMRLMREKSSLKDQMTRQGQISCNHSSAPRTTSSAPRVHHASAPLVRPVAALPTPTPRAPPTAFHHRRANSYHKREASFDSGLGLAALSLTPDEPHFQSASSNEMNFHVNDLCLDSHPAPHLAGPPPIDHQLEELLDSLPASNVDVMGQCDAGVTYEQVWPNNPSCGDDVISAQQRSLDDVLTRDSNPCDLNSNGAVWI